MARGGFSGFPGGNNMQQLMRQAQKLQQQALEMNEKLDSMEYTGTAGGGAVTCTVNGLRQLVSLKINKDVVDPDKCIGCKKCLTVGCPAMNYNKDEKKVVILRDQCVGCDVCAQVCPVQAIGKEAK